MVHLPASRHNAGVATGVIVNIGNVVPVANKEESREQETDEDSLSTTSTIDYPEEDPNYPEEDDEDDEGEVDMTYTKSKPKPAQANKEDETLKNKWVASWKNPVQRQCPTWIHVYAYFDKKLGYGGYGVILRNARAKPIIGSAKYSRKGKSFFYQVFKGVKAGVELAEELGLSDLHAKCNSGVAPHLFHDARRCSDDACINTRNLDLICDGCFCCLVSYKGCDVSPLVLELRGKKKLIRLSTSWDQAAHYLAKRGKILNRRPGVEKTEARIGPEDFPQQLQNILWKHAVVASHLYQLRKATPLHSSVALN